MSLIQRVLAIETSCDDTSVAVVADGGWVVELQSAAQDLAHRPYGGVVPEVAGREHFETLLPLIDQVVEKVGGWDSLHGIAVTNRPGLLGSLMVGVVTAKTLALTLNKPLIGVNHLEGHLVAPFLSDTKHKAPLPFPSPYIALAVSGGHTSLYLVKKFGDYVTLSTTRDDAAGEAYDKFGKMLGLGFPAGVKVDQLAQKGQPQKFQFPRAMMEANNIEFSFSGLKTSAMKILEGIEANDRHSHVSDLCAGFQEAVADVLIEKLKRALKLHGLKQAVITGGVSANSRLREKAQALKNEGFNIVIPPLRFCTDNAAMIGWAGLQRLQRGERDNQWLAPSPEMRLDVS